MKFNKEVAILFKFAIVSSMVFIPWSQSQAEEIGTPLNKLYAEDGIAGKVTSVENLPTSNSNPVSVSAAALQIIPASPTSVGNCIPFGNNTEFGFTGFIYRNVPAFNLPAGAKIRFDLGQLNTQDIRRNIFFGRANKNPNPGVLNGMDVISQNITVDTSGWKLVVSEKNPPISNPKGNTISGDYELTYIADAPFNFAGGGLLIGFQGSPPSSYVDNGCEQVLVSTTTNDASGNFYARFFYRPNLSTGVLDVGPGGTGLAIGGVILDDLFNCLGLTCTINGKPSEAIIQGTNSDDVICGTDKADIILGKMGHDTVCGGAGDDVILADNGHDRVDGGTGNDVLDGGTGMDMLDGGPDNDVLLGGNDGDLLYGGMGFDYLSGGLGQDMLNGGPDNDICEKENSDKLLVSCENKVSSTNMSVLTLDKDLVSPELANALNILKPEMAK